MKIKYLLLLMFLPTVFNAQETRHTDQNVELPEFVITGVERVSMPVANKLKAQLVPTLSTEFFKPSYPTEELPIADLSNPIKKDIQIISSYENTLSRLILGAGIYNLPTGEFTYGKNFSNGIFTGRLWGTNQRAYISNAGMNYSGAEIKTDLFIDRSSQMFPGAKFSAGGDYERRGYKFFASPVPNLKRDVYNGNIHLRFSDLSSEKIRFDLRFLERMLYVKDADLGENTFNGRFSVETGFNGFIFGGSVNYINQSLSKIVPGSANSSFIDNKVYLKIHTSNNLEVGAGLNYASAGGSSNFFAPFGTIVFKLDKNFTLLGEFNPGADFVTTGDLLDQNRFMNVNSINNIFVKKTNNFKAAVKYEYDTYFEIDAGVKFTKYDNFPFFNDKNMKGIFDVKTIEAKRFGLFANALFHLGPFGMLYAGLEFEDFKDLHAKLVPYNSALNMNLNYGYDFSDVFRGELKLNASTLSFGDTLNSPQFRLPGFFNGAVKLTYKIWQDFNIYSQFSNIFNDKYYLWRGYQEKPFDFTLGIDYRW